MNLALADSEIDAFQRFNAGKGFADALHFQQDFTWGTITHGAIPPLWLLAPMGQIVNGYREDHQNTGDQHLVG